LLAALTLLAACGRRSESYFPLHKGWRWTYDIDVVTMDGPQQKRLVIENLGVVDLAGQRLSARASADGTITYYREDNAGVQRIGETRPDAPTQIYSSPRTVLPKKMDGTASWTDTEFTVALEHTGPPENSLNRITVPVDMRYVVEAIGDEVNVPAGEFAGCVRIKGTGMTSQNVGFYVGQTEITIENTEWYAPGVGLVKSTRKEMTTSKTLPRGGYELRLRSFARR
jgi:hypothetical protein